MSDALLLPELETRAGQILAESERLLDAAPADAQWKPSLEKVVASAREVARKAGEPVKIAVVGEFSAGKTLLLGSLIGYADGLPVDELPTTGNVTALRFTLKDELATTVVGPYHIRYLDHDGVHKCLDHMLREARKRAKQADLREDLQQKLAAIKADDPTAPSRLEEWGRQAWAKENPLLRYLIRELVLFVRAYARCGAGLCDSAEEFEVPSEAAREGLKLGTGKLDIQTLAFDELPFPVSSLSDRPHQLTPQQIRDSFPLIQLVSVDVTVSRKVWDFSELTGAKRFTLMDFPGLGADSSGVRDLFLSLREMKETQTILIALDSRKPGGNEGARIYNLLQENRAGEDIRDMVLVAVGRFDQIPLSVKDREKLAELSGVRASETTKAAGGKFSDDDEEEEAPAVAGPEANEALVQQGLPILAKCIMGAEALVPTGRRDRIVLVSPPLHLKQLEDRNTGLEVASAAFAGQLRSDAEKAQSLRKLWQGVVARWEKKSASQPLRRWLEDFVADGGISRLRDLIQSHVAGHGLDQRGKDVRREVVKLNAALNELMQALPRAEAKDNRTPEDKLQAAETIFRGLADTYQKKINDLRQSARLQVQRNGSPAFLEEVLRIETVYRVYSWEAWDALHQSSKDSHITERAPGESKFADEDDEGGEEEGAGGSSFPVRSEDFYPQFVETVQQLEAFTRKLLEEGLTHWLEKLAMETAAAQATLSPLLDRKTLAKDLKALKLGQRGEGLVGALRAAVDTARFRKALNNEGNLESLEMRRPNPDQLFPLARTRDNAQGRIFGWSRTFEKADENSRPDRHHSHLSMVQRIRDQELISILRQEMQQLLSEGMQEVIKDLEQTLAQVRDRLSLAAGNRFVLETILRAPEGNTESAGPSPLVDVHRLASSRIQ